MYVYIYIYIYICIYVYLYLCLWTCILYIYAYTYAFTYIHIYIHIYMSSNRCGKFGSTSTRNHNRAKEKCWQHTSLLQIKLLLMTTWNPMCDAPWWIFHISYLIDRINSTLWCSVMGIQNLISYIQYRTLMTTWVPLCDAPWWISNISHLISHVEISHI